LTSDLEKYYDTASADPEHACCRIFRSEPSFGMRALTKSSRSRARDLLPPRPRILAWVLAIEVLALVGIGLQMGGWSYGSPSSNIPTPKHPLHVVCFDGRDRPVYDANVIEASRHRDVNAIHFTELGSDRIDMINADDVCHYTPMVDQ
jgi:hypothetical protein